LGREKKRTISFSNLSVLEGELMSSNKKRGGKLAFNVSRWRRRRRLRPSVKRSSAYSVKRKKVAVEKKKKRKGVSRSALTRGEKKEEKS